MTPRQALLAHAALPLVFALATQAMPAPAPANPAPNNSAQTTSNAHPEAADPTVTADPSIGPAYLRAAGEEEIYRGPRADREAEMHPARYRRESWPECSDPDLREGLGNLATTTCMMIDDEMAALDCPPGAEKLGALWSSLWDSQAGEYGMWRRIDEGSCSTVAGSAVQVLEAFRTLKVRDATPVVQPAHWSLVNMRTPVHADAVTQLFEIELLGQGLVIEARPSTFTWDFGDDTLPLTTANPGRAWVEGDEWPDDSWVGHTWNHAGSYSITLNTRWTGRYSLAGTGEWHSIDGEISTTSTTGPIEVVEARSQLVGSALG